MPYTPLIPLPADQATTQTLDPFDELLYESTPNLLPPTSSPSTNRSSTNASSFTKPIQIPRLRSRTSLSLLNVITPPPSSSAAECSSEFGAFVSVSPSQDPLATILPPQFSHSPKTSKTALSEIAFVDEARRRTRSNERRFVGEILVADEKERKERVEAFHHKSPSSAQSDSFGEFQTAAVQEEGGDEVVDLLFSQSPRTGFGVVPSPPTSLLPPFNHSKSPGNILAHRHRTSSSPALSETNMTAAPHHVTSVLSSRLAHTLPRKWTSLLSSTLSSSSSSPSPSSATSKPPTPEPVPSILNLSSSSTHHSDVVPRSVSSIFNSNVPVTHTSPFAFHPYVPPDGAPGFEGDHNWDKGFTHTPPQSLGDHVSLIGRSESARIVLPLEIVEHIRRHIPPLYRLGQEWTLLYSLDQHGISLGTLYSRTSKFTTEGGCLLCVKDDNDTIFGVWIGDGIRRSIGESYYGSGESFLWKQQADTDFSDGRPTKARVFKWTGKNEYVALCLPDSMSFGGGDGKYGLFLDSNLLDGSSAPCPTFDNEILCSDLQDGKGMARFECVGLEVWGIPR